MRVARLPQALARQDLQARDRQARETLALLDPSLQSTLDVNAEVRSQQNSCRCTLKTLHEVSRGPQLFRSITPAPPIRPPRLCTRCTRQLLRKSFAHYCHKYARRSGPKARPYGQHSGQFKKDNAQTVKLGGNDGKVRTPRSVTPTLNFEGGKAFATDIGLVGEQLRVVLRGRVWSMAITLGACPLVSRSKAGIKTLVL